MRRGVPVAELAVDVPQLEGLVQELGELVGYCQALRDAAVGFAYLLPGEWQGPASSSFVATFELWRAGAEGLRDGADGLREQAAAALSVHRATIDALDVAWREFQSAVSG